MTLVRIGKIIINFDTVTTVTNGLESGSLIVRFINEQTQTFAGDEAHGLQAFLDRTVKSAVKPLEDFVMN